jgi:hypothetical protein
LSAGEAISKIDLMKLNKNIGMLLLAVYIIIDSLLGFGLNLGPGIFLLYLVGLAAGIFILIGK